MEWHPPSQPPAGGHRAQGKSITVGGPDRNRLTPVPQMTRVLSRRSLGKGAGAVVDHTRKGGANRLCHVSDQLGKPVSGAAVR
jgi:hypothetical protein